MSFLNNLPKEFIRSAVRQVGRDGGKVISNKIYKGKHGTPIYDSSINPQIETLNNSDLANISNVDMSIQPEIKDGNLWVIIKGLLIQIVPFGILLVLMQGYNYRKMKTAKIYINVPNRVADKRYKEGYRIEGNSIIKTNQQRQLSEQEVTRIKQRGLYYLLSVPLFFIVAYIIYITSYK